MTLEEEVFESLGSTFLGAIRLALIPLRQVSRERNIAAVRQFARELSDMAHKLNRIADIKSKSTTK